MNSIHGFGTNAVHVGQAPEQWEMNQVCAPIFVPFFLLFSWAFDSVCSLLHYTDVHTTTVISNAFSTGRSSDLDVHHLQAGYAWQAQGIGLAYDKKDQRSLQVHSYGRTGNPTRDVLESNLAALEDAQFCENALKKLKHTFHCSIRQWITSGCNIVRT